VRLGHKKRDQRHTCSKGDYIQAKESPHPTLLHLDLGLSTSRVVRKEIFLLFVVFCMDTR
jgi:hypothetical protein